MPRELFSYKTRKPFNSFLVQSHLVKVQPKCQGVQCRGAVFHLLFGLSSAWHGSHRHVLQFNAGMHATRLNEFQKGIEILLMFSKEKTFFLNQRSTTHFPFLSFQEQVIYKLTNLKKCASQCFKCKR